MVDQFWNPFFTNFHGNRMAWDRRKSSFYLTSGVIQPVAESLEFVLFCDGHDEALVREYGEGGWQAIVPQKVKEFD